MATVNRTIVTIRVELFGTPRLRTKRSVIELTTPRHVRLDELVSTLGQACPELVGHAIQDDLSGLQEGFVLNLNGTRFLSRDDLTFGPGDSLLLMSNQAGG